MEGLIKENLGEIMQNNSSSERRVQQAQTDRLIRLHDVIAICGTSKTSVYAAIKAGDFPAPVKLGLRTSRWIESEVYRWVQDRITSNRPS